MKPSEILVTNKDTIREIMKQHGLTNICVIGSCTRGEDREDSDIDFLVRLANTAVDRKSLDAYTPVFNAEEDLAAVTADANVGVDILDQATSKKEKKD